MELRWKCDGLSMDAARPAPNIPSWLPGHLDGYKRSVPLLIPVPPLYYSRSIPKTWVYAQSGNFGSRLSFGCISTLSGSTLKGCLWI
jgi:hypothetical protein